MNSSTQIFDEFWNMVDYQGVEIPSGVCEGLDEADFDLLYQASIIHEKPLTNALGERFADVLTKEKVVSLFKKM